jgi:serine/threonine protein kinase
LRPYLQAGEEASRYSAATEWFVVSCSYHPPMPLSEGQTFAGYRIVRLLGSGGMGEVYLGEHPRLPRRDAVKMLPADVSLCAAGEHR